MAWGCINSGKAVSSLGTTYLVSPWLWELCLLVLHFIAGQGVSAGNGSTVSAWESIELSQTEQLSRNGSGGDATRETGPKRGMILPFQPLSITFEDIKYYVDMPAVPIHTCSHFLCFGSFPYIIWSTMLKYHVEVPCWSISRLSDLTNSGLENSGEMQLGNLSLENWESS